MTSSQIKKKLRLGLAALAGGFVFSAVAPAAAQTGYSAYPEDAGTALSRHLKTLAQSPRNLSALMGAAKAALELGDAQAAATFYARAEEIAPRDGRIKAGLGSAFLAMEQVQAALKFFEDARALGAPEGEYAADRGLAHDLLGNPTQAQRDYAIAMRANDTPELRRRLALSKAISGDRDGALALIDEQLRRQDRSAWRVRAFILALTGDATGATEAVRAVMPAQAAAMQPFLTRLPTLRPGDRAMAVHFGYFPNDAGVAQAAPVPQQYAGVSPALTQNTRPTGIPSGATGPVRPAPVTQPPLASPRSSTARPAAAGSTAARRSDEPRSGLSFVERRELLRGDDASRRRGVSGPVETGTQQASTRQPAALATAETRLPAAIGIGVGTAQPAASAPGRTVQPNVASSVVGTAIAPVQTPAATPPIVAPLSAADAIISKPVQGPPPETALLPAAPPVQAAPASILPQPSSAVAPTQLPAAATQASSAPAATETGLTSLVPSSVASPRPQPPAAEAGSTGAIVSTVTTPAPALSAPVAAAPAPMRASAISSGLAAVAATIRALPEEEPKAEPKPPLKVAEAKPEPKKLEAPKEEPAAEAGAPSRHWVQIASAPDSLVLSEYQRLKNKAPKLLGDTTGWRAAFRSTNRVLVGPFKDEADAQALVNALGKANIRAVPWTSAEGQEIEKLAAK